MREEVKKIAAFWLQLGVAGFRMDAAPFVIELTEPDNPNPPKDFDYLRELRELMAWRRGDALVLAEANAEPAELTEYFGSGDRLPMLFNFLLNQQVFLGLARGDAGADPHRPDHDARHPPVLPVGDVPPQPRRDRPRPPERVTTGRRCSRSSAPSPRCSSTAAASDGGWRPCSVATAGGSRWPTACSSPCRGHRSCATARRSAWATTSRLPERDSVRTPMQWSDGPNAGFSTAAAGGPAPPVIADGQFGYPKVNVAAQRRDPHSLLTWMERALHTLRECPEFAIGSYKALDTGERSVLALRYEAPSGVMLALTNLADEPCTVDLAEQLGDLPDAPIEVFGDGDYGDPRPDPSKLELNGYGYRWIRLGQSIGAE